MADTNVPEASVSSAQNLAGELDTMGKQIETLAEDPLKKETREQLKGLHAAIADPTADLQYLRMQIDHLRSGINAVQKMQQGKEQIREVLTELSPQKIESVAQLTESIVNILPEGKYKTLLRGYAGSVILEQFEKNNHRIIIGADNTISLSLIDESKKTPEITQNKIDLEAKLNALMKGGKLNIDTLRIGTLYRAPSFIAYGDIVRDKKGEVLDKTKTGNPKEYFQYLLEKQKKGYVLNTAEETYILSEDKGGFTGLSSESMLSAVTEAKNLGQMQKVADQMARQFNNTPSNPSDQQSGNRAPSVVGEGIGTMGAGLGKIAGAGARGGVNLVGDMLNSAMKEGGVWGGLAVLGGLIAAVWKLGFWKTLGGIFGIGVVSEAAAGRIDLDKETAKLKAAGAAVGATADKAVTAVSGQEAGTVKPEEKPKLTPSQEKAVEKIKKSHPQINEMIESHIKTQGKKKGVETANIDQYFLFIHSNDFQNRKVLDMVNPSNFDESIFSSEMNFDRKNQNTLNPILLKKLLRAYIAESHDTEMPGQNMKRGLKEKDVFMVKFGSKITKDTTFADITKEIYPV